MYCCEEYGRAHRANLGFTNLRYCPWCGSDNRRKHPLEVAAQKVVDAIEDDEGVSPAISKLKNELKRI